MFYQKVRQLIMEENDVATVLATINRHQKFFSNSNKLVGNCGWDNDPTKWYVNFNASTREWGRIAGDLSRIGELVVKVNSGGTTNLYFIRK